MTHDFLIIGGGIAGISAAARLSHLGKVWLAETEAQFSARLQQGLDELIARTPHNGRALLVSHGIAITTILKMIDAQSILYQSVPNASVSRLHHQNGRWVIQSIGDTSFSLL